MENVKIYFRKNSEQVFALTLLLTIVGINYLVPYKLVFLSFYFLVVVLGTYYLETTKRFSVVYWLLCWSPFTSTIIPVISRFLLRI